MEVKYYYYISENKVRMLSSQFFTDKPSLTISPKVEIAGVSLGIDYEAKRIEHKFDIVRATTTLLNQLYKHGLIANVRSQDNAMFLKSTGRWSHGLASICHWEGSDKVSTDSRELIYVAVKKQGRDLYLLVGSPLNILGENRIETSYVVCSSTAYGLGQMQQCFSLQDTFHQTVSALEQDGSAYGETFYISAVRSESRYKFTNNHIVSNSIVHDSTIIDGISIGKSREINDDLILPQSEINGLGIALSLYCSKVLGNLPFVPLDTVFRVFRRLPVNKFGIENLYFGSPIYTALI